MPHTERDYKYETLPSYPNMREADRTLWDVFVLQNPGRFDRVWYDWLVGEPAEMEIEASQAIKDGWRDLLRWRIDVIGEDAEALWVIEIKPAATASALGQALAYSALLAKGIKSSKPIRPAIITDSVTPMLQEVAEQMGVVVWQV